MTPFVVDCGTDGMTLFLEADMARVDGRIFVRGQTENPFCSKKLSPLLNSSDSTFKVLYSHCNVRYEEPVCVYNSHCISYCA